MSVIALLGKLVEKIAISIAAKWITDKGSSFLGFDETKFTTELRGVIYKTIVDYSNEYPISKQGDKFPFYDSEIIMEALISIKLLGRDINEPEYYQSLLSTNEKIIPIEQWQIIKFLDIFEENCKNNDVLVKHQFNDNYKYAVFQTLEVVNQINNTLSKFTYEISTALKGEFITELEEIFNHIKAFKPKTALDRLEALELRIRQNNLNTNEIEAKILFLKGKCNLEIHKNSDGHELIVNSYLKNKDSQIKGDVAVAYANLDEDTKATEIAKEIIDEDPFNVNAWLVLIFIAKANFRDVLKDVPVSVQSKQVFKITLIRYLKFVMHLDSKQYEDIHYELPDTLDSNITFNNKNYWEIVIVLTLNNFYENPQQFGLDFNGKVYYEDTDKVYRIVELINKFLSPLKGSEILENYYFVRFYHMILKNVIGQDDFDKQEFKTFHEKLRNDSPPADLYYSQYLVNIGKVEDGLQILETSKFKEDRIIFLHRIFFNRVLKRDDVANKLLSEHLKAIDSIGFNDIYNIIGLLELLPDKSTLQEVLNEFLTTKTFENEFIKELFKHTVSINYLGENSHETANSLVQLAIHFKDEKVIVLFIAQLLFKIEEYTKCRLTVEPFAEETKQNELNLLYCLALMKEAKDLKFLLKFVEQIRLANDNNYYQLLYIENNLRSSINDTDGILDISLRAVNQYPKAEFFHANLLTCFERKGMTTEFQEFVKSKLQSEYKDEAIGLRVSGILVRNGYKLEAANIMYKLALIQTNHNARTSYLTFPFPENYFLEYTSIEVGSYVKLLDKKGGVKLLQVMSDDKYSLIGKSINQHISVSIKSGSVKKDFKIDRIMNAPLYLIEQIQFEARDENSELDIEILNLNDDDGNFSKERFENFILERLAVPNEIRKKKNEDIISKYNLGEKSFSEMCMALFSRNPVNCYYYLCANNFFAVPSYHNSLIEANGTTSYAIDFTSLILFYELKIQCNIIPQTKYLISPIVLLILNKELTKLQLFPSNLTVTTDGNNVLPINYTDNYNHEQIEVYQGLLQFIEDYCEVITLEEKVELIPAIANVDDQYTEYLIDCALLASNPNNILISNDYYLVRNIANLRVISPESYFTKVYKGRIPMQIGNYFLENKYIGVTITKEQIITEYEKKQLGKDNNFNICLYNLKFKWSYSIVNMGSAIGFLKYLYTNDLGTIEDKALLSQTIFLNILDGCSRSERVVTMLRMNILATFSLLGFVYDEVLASFETALHILNKPH